MRRFAEGVDRGQGTLFPECLEDWIYEDNPVRAIDVFADGLDLAELGPILRHGLLKTFAAQKDGSFLR